MDEQTAEEIIRRVEAIAHVVGWTSGSGDEVEAILTHGSGAVVRIDQDEDEYYNVRFTRPGCYHDSGDLFILEDPQEAALVTQGFLFAFANIIPED